MQDFFQNPPQLGNTFQTDHQLQRILKVMGGGLLPQWSTQLQELGEMAAGPMLALAAQAEREIPRHIPFDAWGKRIDQIETSDAWKAMERIAATQGIVATGYERQYGPHSRILQMALLYLYHPSSALFSCPLAMTDGAARALEIYGDHPEMKAAFQNLISRDPRSFWTSGQWMTERKGGSDVGQSETQAQLTNSEYHLFGTKWFTSSTTSQMAMALARPEGAEAGGRGLSLFFVRMRDEEGRLRQIRIHRLKDKMGTKALPTAELSLEGTPALLVGGLGGGVKKISTLFNVTRIYNAVCSVAAMQRGLALAADYAGKRFVFGRLLDQHPLHLDTFSDIAAEKAACTLLVFKTAELWGKDDCGNATPEESALLRCLTTLSKLITGKASVRVVSEIIESFGGAGYVEDTELPTLMRNTHVFPIWEGTTNVLALDILRAFAKDSPFEVFARDINERLSHLHQGSEAPLVARIQDELKELTTWLSQHIQENEILALNARHLAIAMGQIYMKSLLCEFAGSTGHPADLEAARRYGEKALPRFQSRIDSVSLSALLHDLRHL